VRELLRVARVRALNRRCFTTQVDARLAVFEYIEGWYNPHRHSALDYESPISYEKKHRLAA
jgi:putative transposase